MSRVPGDPDGAAVLLTCTDLRPEVIARLFISDRPWSTILSCGAGVADRGTLQLLDLFQAAEGIEKLVVLQHTDCHSFAPTRPANGRPPTAHAVGTGAALAPGPADERLAATLDTLRAHFPTSGDHWLSGFLYSDSEDELITWR